MATPISATVRLIEKKKPANRKKISPITRTMASATPIRYFRASAARCDSTASTAFSTPSIPWLTCCSAGSKAFTLSGQVRVAFASKLIAETYGVIARRVKASRPWVAACSISVSLFPLAGGCFKKGTKRSAWLRKAFLESEFK